MSKINIPSENGDLMLIKSTKLVGLKKQLGSRDMEDVNTHVIPDLGGFVRHSELPLRLHHLLPLWIATRQQLAPHVDDIPRDPGEGVIVDSRCTDVRLSVLVDDLPDAKHPRPERSGTASS